MSWKPATQRVLDALAAKGVVVEPSEFAESTRTAAEAAAAIGTSVAQIVKSMIFLANDEPILVLTSGENQVDTGLLGASIEATITRAPAERVRAATGFAIGGVPPVAHAHPMSTFMDADLLAFDVVWAAAGTHTSVFPIAPTTLRDITSARVLRIKTG